MEQRTHLRIDAGLCGTPLELSEGRARVALDADDRMTADEHGLVHGGFPFGLADYAAMLAVNDPNVVLGTAEIRFLKPVARGDRLEADAVVEQAHEKKRRVRVVVRRDGERVLEGQFLCFVLDHHVLTHRK